MITAFQVSVMAQQSEIQFLIKKLSSPNSPMRKLTVTTLTDTENIRKNEDIDKFARTLKDLNNISLNIFGKDLSSDFIKGINATIYKIIEDSFYKYDKDSDLYFELLEESLFTTINTKNLHDLFMYFQVCFRIKTLWTPYVTLSSDKSLIIKDKKLFETISKYFLLVDTGVTTQSFSAYINDSNLFSEELITEVDKIAELVKQKRSKILNSRDDTEE